MDASKLVLAMRILASYTKLRLGSIRTPTHHASNRRVSSRPEMAVILRNSFSSSLDTGAKGRTPWQRIVV
jgi:hypothetical protein